MTPTIEAKAVIGRRVDTMFVRTNAASGKKTAIFPSKNLQVPLDENDDPEIEVEDAERAKLLDYKGHGIGMNSASFDAGDKVLTLPDGSTWAFDSKWEPCDWSTPPSRMQASAIYTARQKRLVELGLPRKVGNPLDLMNIKAEAAIALDDQDDGEEE